MLKTHFARVCFVKYQHIFHFTRVCAYVGTLGMVPPGDRLPEDVTFVLVVGFARNYRQMRDMSLYFHLAKVLRDSDN